MGIATEHGVARRPLDPVKKILPVECVAQMYCSRPCAIVARTFSQQNVLVAGGVQLVPKTL